MGFINSLIGIDDGIEVPDVAKHTAVPAGAELAAALDPPEGLQSAIRCRPFKNSRGIADGKQFLRAVHNPLTDRTGTVRSPASSFELRYADGVINFQFVPGSADMADSMLAQLETAYHDSHFERAEPTLIGAEVGEHIAATRRRLRKPTVNPIEHLDLKSFDVDPFAAITKEMVTDFSGGLSDVVVQVMFRAIPRGWTDSPEGEPSITDIAQDLTEPTYRKRRRLWSSYYKRSTRARRTAKPPDSCLALDREPGGRALARHTVIELPSDASLVIQVGEIVVHHDVERFSAILPGSSLAYWRLFSRSWRQWLC